MIILFLLLQGLPSVPVTEEFKPTNTIAHHGLLFEDATINYSWDEKNSSSIQLETKFILGIKTLNATPTLTASSYLNVSADGGRELAD